MATIGTNSKPAYVYDAGTDTWIPIGPGEHTHEYIGKDVITTTGDIIYASAANTPARRGIGSTGQVLTVSGGLPTWAAPATASFVGVSAYNVAQQTLSNNTGTAITFSNEDYDTDGFHSTTTNTSRFTIPSGKAGKYLLTAVISYLANATGNRTLYFYKNGNPLSYAVQTPGTSTFYTNMSASMVTTLSEGDYIEMFGWQTSGNNLNVSGDSETSRIALTYLGA
jgi:uncharacterized SAM-binding protein YcdF (DUF218 family)